MAHVTKEIVDHLVEGMKEDINWLIGMFSSSSPGSSGKRLESSGLGFGLMGKARRGEREEGSDVDVAGSPSSSYFSLPSSHSNANGHFLLPVVLIVLAIGLAVILYIIDIPVIAKVQAGVLIAMITAGYLFLRPEKKTDPVKEPKQKQFDPHSITTIEFANFGEFEQMFKRPIKDAFDGVGMNIKLVNHKSIGFEIKLGKKNIYLSVLFDADIFNKEKVIAKVPRFVPLDIPIVSHNGTAFSFSSFKRTMRIKREDQLEFIASMLDQYNVLQVHFFNPHQMDPKMSYEDLPELMVERGWTVIRVRIGHINFDHAWIFLKSRENLPASFKKFLRELESNIPNPTSSPIKPTGPPSAPGAEKASYFSLYHVGYRAVNPTWFTVLPSSHSNANGHFLLPVVLIVLAIGLAVILYISE